MSHLSYEDAFSQNSSAAVAETPAVTEVPTTPQASVSVSSGPKCTKCQAYLATEQTPVCPNCGWYESLGMHVEVSKEWESAAQAQGTPHAAPNHLEVWMNLIPVWGWVMIGSAIAVLGGSAAVGFVVVADNPDLRTLWGVSQLLGGIVLTIVMHLTVFLMIATADADVGLLDIVVKPLQAWIKVFNELPKRLIFANLANMGLCASLGAATLIGGIPYENLLDWGFEPPPKKSLIGAVAERASQLPGKEQSLEDAVKDFAGDAAGNAEEGDGSDKGAGKASAERLSIDCLIIGLKLDKEGNLRSLVLATEAKGKLTYAGVVSPHLSDRELSELAKQLQNAKSSRPFVRTNIEAIWLQPRSTCRVTYSKQEENGVLREIEWDKLLGTISLW